MKNNKAVTRKSTDIYNPYCIVNFYHYDVTGKNLNCRKCPLDCKCKTVEVL